MYANTLSTHSPLTAATVGGFFYFTTFKLISSSFNSMVFNKYVLSCGYNFKRPISITHFFSLITQKGHVQSTHPFWYDCIAIT